VYECVYVYECVCKRVNVYDNWSVCVREKEREKKRQTDRQRERRNR